MDQPPPDPGTNGSTPQANLPVASEAPADALPRPNPVPGRSALAAFLPVERWLAERSAARQAEAGGLEQEIRAEARRIREEGEARLKEVVKQAEQDALRSAQARAHDRESAARREVEAWVASCDEMLEALVAEAVTDLTSVEGARALRAASASTPPARPSSPESAPSPPPPAATLPELPDIDIAALREGGREIGGTKVEDEDGRPLALDLDAVLRAIDEPPSDEQED